jgi:ubiquinone/menaquinone biosynthesis C-methylase UbiE/UDP-N-acetylglucosamine transferase subunit ALG13
MEILVTVGMGRWPFDRLVAAAAALHPEHDVFIQSGTSTIRPPCPHAPFIRPEDLQERIARADVVITHAGNTVRNVQRQGKVPIVVPRTAARGEMGNDHHVEFLQDEELNGRVAAVWDVADLGTIVRGHREIERRLLTERPPPPVPDAEHIIRTLDEACRNAIRNPFAGHPLRRYAYAWRRLATGRGRHLDIGFGDGHFLAALAANTELECHGVEPHTGRFHAIVRAHPELSVLQVAPGDSLPYTDASFHSVSLLDVLEHCPDDRATLREVHRVLRPGGTVVLTVPAQHAFSWLDPDNVKLRFPRLHRRLYSLRFGVARYEERFGDRSDGLFGDMSRGVRRHTNYVRERLAQHVEEAGLESVDWAGANLFWRLLPVPELVPDGPARRLVERAVLLDGRLFSRANLFLTARRPE